MSLRVSLNTASHHVSSSLSDTQEFLFPLIEFYGANTWSSPDIHVSADDNSVQQISAHFL